MLVLRLVPTLPASGRPSPGALAHQAFHDPLTGLPNRLLFRDGLEHALTRRAEHRGAITVLFLDLDEFKVVNDTLGHEAGDRLLVAVAERLRRCLREGGTLARLGGDEFTILLEDLPNPKTAGMLAERVAEALRAPFRLDNREVVVTASIGIAVPTTGAHAEEVLRLADVAMYEAKHRGKDRVAVFDVGMDARTWQRLGMEADLRRALTGDQLRLHFQPLVALDGGRISGEESLVRWEHPVGGLVQPGEFIPLAEETGLIVSLGRWVLVESCRQVAAWQQAFPTEPPLGLAVNLSARQFQHPALVADVAKALAESGLPASSLTLEVTETTALKDVTGAISALQALKELGVRLAIDDFGAGYAGLGYLRRCPVDRLKNDRSYVAGLGFNQADMAMVRAVVEFARVLGIEVTAEGIETAAQLAAVRALGCHQGQGFYFSRPVPAGAMTDLLAGEARSGDQYPHPDSFLPDRARNRRCGCSAGPGCRSRMRSRRPVTIGTAPSCQTRELRSPHRNRTPRRAPHTTAVQPESRARQRRMPVRQTCPRNRPSPRAT